MHRWLYVSLVAAATAFGQPVSYPYAVKTVAGTFPLGDGGPAASALLFNPSAALPDASGNLYILDSGNLRIRKVTLDGNIGTAVTLAVPGNDMKLAKDGSFYITTFAKVIKVSASGAVTTVAGTGTSGFSGDEGPGTSAQVGSTAGIALDTAGNVFFVDGNRVREVTLDGRIHTIAGPAAQLSAPVGIAVDKSGNVYVADQGNHVVRKIAAGGATTPAGTVTTIAGDGNPGRPSVGPALASHFGTLAALALDDAGSLYLTDTSFGSVLQLGPDGNLTLFAGTFNSFGPSPDGRAVNSSLQTPVALSLDAAGNVFVTDQGTHRIREVTLDGFLHTVAGRLHFGGDTGPATAALLNQPADVALDGQGGVYIGDSFNYRIRKVTPDGIINTFAGTGVSSYPGDGSSAIASPLAQITAMTTDAKGTLFLASGLEVVSITPAGTVGLVAGDGNSADAGDGGPATKASFLSITGVAVDAAGNVYIADAAANRVRRVTASNGNIVPYVGTGVRGFTIDGAPAIASQLNLGSGGALAVDPNGRLYVADNGNVVVRMVTFAGDLVTAVGNGVTGQPADGQPAKSTAFSGAAGLAFDSAGNLYVTAQGIGEMYRVSNGILQRIGGGGTGALADGVLATSTAIFGQGIKVDSAGTIYVADPKGNAVRKLLLNSPVSAAVADGNLQTGVAGQALPKPIKLLVTGTAGAGVPGVTVNFSVTTGSATLSAASVQTDTSGIASVVVTLGGSLGNVVITATVPALSGAQPFQFTETVTPNPTCPILSPSITSVTSAGDYGALSTFASGSWLEIKGSNLALTTRQWGGSDFQGANAPTSLDGTIVQINGLRGYVQYISSGQVNVQAPADFATGPVSVTVTNCIGTSAPVMVTKAAVAGGLLAPASFNAGGKQYLAALFPDGTFAGDPALISGTLRPAKPGDTLTVYGIGFGDVTPATPPGIVVSQTNTLANLTVAFGQTPAMTTSAGLAVNYIGLYQLNLVVPNMPDGDYQINVSVNGVPGAQVLFLTVHK